MTNATLAVAHFRLQPHHRCRCLSSNRPGGAPKWRFAVRCTAHAFAQRQQQRCSVSYNFSNVRELRQHPFRNARQIRSNSIFFSTYSATCDTRFSAALYFGGTQFAHAGQSSVTSCDMHPGITLLLHQNSDLSGICNITACYISDIGGEVLCYLRHLRRQPAPAFPFILDLSCSDRDTCACIATAEAFSARFTNSHSAV